MGAIQGSINNVLGTAAAITTLGKHISQEGEKVELAKQVEADKLQEEYIQDVEAIDSNSTEQSKLLKATSAKNSSVAHRMGFDDKEAAERALNITQQKINALVGLKERAAKRFKKITGEDIEGGKE